MTTIINDEELRELLQTFRPYSVALLCWGPNRHMEGAKAIAWEHRRRMASLRADGVMSIVCPVVDAPALRRDRGPAHLRRQHHRNRHRLLPPRPHQSPAHQWPPAAFRKRRTLNRPLGHARRG